MAAQVFGTCWRWNNVNGHWKGGVSLEWGWRWRMAVHSQSVWHNGNKWVCTPTLAILHTQTLLILIHIEACQLIYFHLRSQVRKFGRVTKSTNRTCPWAVQFLLFSLSCFRLLLPFSRSTSLSPPICRRLISHLTFSFIKVKLHYVSQMFPYPYWQTGCRHISCSLWLWWDEWSKFE